MARSMPRPRAVSCSASSCWGVLTFESASAANRRTRGTASIRISSRLLALFVAQTEAACHDCKVSTLDESRKAQLIEKRRDHRGVAILSGHDAETIGAPRFLRVRRERPCDCRAAERRDKLTADYHVLRNDVALDLCAALISSDRRRCSALSNSLTRPLRSAISFIRPRARMLSSATKKEPSPLTIARPLIAEAGATKNINEAKESKLVANAKVALRANAVIKTGRKRRVSGATPKLCKN